MYTPKHIKKVKLGRSVYMTVNLRTEEVKMDFTTEGMLRIFLEQHKRKPVNGNEFGDWAKKFIKTEFNKIVGKEEE